VFIHGAGGSSAIWFKQIRAFQKYFNVLLIDLRGHGDSRLKAEPAKHSVYTFEEISRDVLNVLDHLGIERAHFVGISLGSVIIRSLYELAPERVASMVLGGAVIRLNLRSRVLIALGNVFKRVLPYLWIYRLAAWILMPRRQNREARAVFIREARKLKQAEFVRWFQLAWGVNPLLRRFEAHEPPVPVLYLMGEHDHMFLPEVRRSVERHRSSVLKIIEHAGHVCNVEAPERFNQYAIAFIQAHRIGAPT